jgi:hypothetical protein
MKIILNKIIDIQKGIKGTESINMWDNIKKYLLKFI